MALPVTKQVIFRKAPLRLVVGQVRFPLLLRFSEPSFLAGFQEAIRSEFPRVAREKQLAFQMSTGGPQPVGEEVLMRFSDRTGEWSVVLGEGALTLEARGYSDIDKFCARLERLFVAARKHLGVSERLRLGLRYINEIRHGDAKTLEDWSKLLRKELVGFAASDLLEGKVEHMVQEVQVQRDDGVLAIRHGLLKGAVVERAPKEPPPPTERFYLLDLDYFDGKEAEFDVASTIKQTRAFNDVIYRFFMWSLSPELKTYLEPIDAKSR